MTAAVSGEPGGPERDAGHVSSCRRASPCATPRAPLAVRAWQPGGVVHPSRARLRGRGARPRERRAREPVEPDMRDQAQASWRLQQVILPGREVAISFDGTLVDVLGRALGADVRRVVKAIHLTPTVEFVAGPVIVPRDGSTCSPFGIRTPTPSSSSSVGPRTRFAPSCSGRPGTATRSRSRACSPIRSCASWPPARRWTVQRRSSFRRAGFRPPGATSRCCCSMHGPGISRRLRGSGGAPH